MTDSNYTPILHLISPLLSSKQQHLETQRGEVRPLLLLVFSAIDHTGQAAAWGGDSR